MTVKNILTMDAASGVSLVSGDDNRVYALVNGNLYRTTDGRPVTGDGRQLREASRSAIAAQLEAARAKLEELKSAEAAPAPVVPAPAPVQPAPEAPKGRGDALIDFVLETIGVKAAEDVAAKIYPEVERRLVEMYGLKPVIHEIKLPERPVYRTEEVLHKDFDAILTAVMMDEPLYLCGPAGTGKSYLAQQIAKALELDFYYANCITDDIQVKGFVDANGNYHTTQFREAFEHGGLFLLDELDASVPEALTILNNALANKSFPFPDRTVTAHENFRCLAAGNTYGTGADNVYTGRYQLDAASLNRFGMFPVDYDRRIEENMTGGDKELSDFAEAFRAAAAKIGIHALCTYRDVKRLHKFAAFMPLPQALRVGMLKGMEAADVRLIAEAIGITNNWVTALKQCGKER